jgi:hypothetical protein
MSQTKLKANELYYYAKIEDWAWWDSDGNASKIHAWLNENTELGTDGCIGQHIYFKHRYELTWFQLRWAH